MVDCNSTLRFEVGTGAGRGSLLSACNEVRLREDRGTYFVWRASCPDLHNEPREMRLVTESFVRSLLARLRGRRALYAAQQADQWSDGQLTCVASASAFKSPALTTETSMPKGAVASRMACGDEASTASTSFR